MQNIVNPNYPLPGFNFRVQFFPALDDNAIGFVEVDGLNISLNKTDELPRHISLRRGFLPFNEFSSWYTDALEHGKSNPLDMDIELLDKNQKAVAIWKIIGAQPISWSLDPLRAMENELAMETVQLKYKKLQRVL